MGNQNSFQSHLDIVDINTNYTFESKLTDSRFGEIKLLKRRETSEKIYQKDFTTNSAKEFEEYVNKIKRRTILIHPNLLKVIGYNSKKDDMFCADFYKISLFFESFETDLEKEISKRRATGNYFSETELRCLLDSVISSCSYLERNQIAHGDIRPYNILITKDHEYKVCDNILFQSAYNPAYFGLLEGLEAKSHYPSPQVFQYYKNKSAKRVDFNPYKNDVYGLGISVLVAAQLEPLEHAYDFTNKRVKEEVIDYSLNNLRGRYTDGFVEALRMLIYPDEARRPSFVELDDEIKAYRSDIRAKAILERTLEAQRNRGVENSVRSGVREANAPNFNQTPHYQDNELDKKIRKAVEKSEGTINRTSPTKYQNEYLDNYIHSYLKREPIQGEKPALYNISPHLKMDSRFVPTLKVYPKENLVPGSQYQTQQSASPNIFSSNVRSGGEYAQQSQHSTQQRPQRDNRAYQPDPLANSSNFGGNQYGGNYGGYQVSSENFSNASESRVRNIPI